MSFSRLTEEREQRIAARWTRARQNWRVLRYVFVLFGLAIFGVALYFSGEAAGLLSCYSSARKTH